MFSIFLEFLGLIINIEIQYSVLILQKSKHNFWSMFIKSET